MREITTDEVDAAIRDLSLRELKSMPVGSAVMVNEVIGYKKMGFWWNVRAKIAEWKYTVIRCIK